MYLKINWQHFKLGAPQIEITSLSQAITLPNYKQEQSQLNFCFETASK
jgi:hypothetical protein